MSAGNENRQTYLSLAVALVYGRVSEFFRRRTKLYFAIFSNFSNVHASGIRALEPHASSALNPSY